jgi:hypothetical protein
MINVNAPETRGVALALQSVTDDLGKGLGPVIVAGGCQLLEVLVLVWCRVRVSGLC